MTPTTPHVPHLTLSTSDLRMVDPAEVDTAQSTMLGAWLAAAAQRPRERHEIPGHPGYWAQVVTQGDASDQVLLVTAFTAATTPHAPLVTVAVAPSQTNAADLWQALTLPRGAVPMHKDSKRPPAPWISVQIWPSMLMDPDAGMWLGVFEREAGIGWLRYLDTTYGNHPTNRPRSGHGS